MTRAVLLPGVPALLREYAGAHDPLPELRTAATEALADLATELPDGAEVAVLCSDSEWTTARPPVGVRLVRDLLADLRPDLRPVRVSKPGEGPFVVVANGTARRSEKAPGHLDERCFAYDDRLRAALDPLDPVALADLDVALGAELLADVAPLQAWGEHLRGAGGRSRVLYDDDPYGVRYWVVTAR